MEQKQFNLERMNKEIINLKQEMENIKRSIREELEFVIRTELAWKEIDEGKYTEYNSPGEFLATFKK